MEVVGKIHFSRPENAPYSKLDLLAEIHVASTESFEMDSVVCLGNGKLLHCRGEKILACANVDKTYSFSKFGPVISVNYIRTVTRKDCLAILQKKCFSIWQYSRFTFAPKYFENVGNSAKVFTYDFFAKGCDQVALLVSDKVRFFEVGFGGIVHELETSQEDCLTVSESLKECLRQISDSIRACQSKLDESKSIAKMILLELKESPMCLLEDSKITGQMSKRPRRTLISNALPTKRLLQIKAEVLKHSDESFGSFIIRNISNQQSIEDIILVLPLSGIERLSYKIHYCENSCRKLKWGENLEFVVHMKSGFSSWNHKFLLDKVHLKYVDSSCGLSHREVIFPLVSSNMDCATERLLALKKVYVKKSVVIRSEFLNGDKILPLLREKLHFHYNDHTKIYSRSGDEVVFFCCSEEKEAHVNLCLFGETEEVLKLFVRELYNFLPDDVYITSAMENETLQNSGAQKSNIDRGRKQLIKEISAIEELFKQASTASLNRLEQHLENTKSVYEERRNRFRSNCACLKIPQDLYLKHLEAILKIEEETDKLFSELILH